MPLHVEQRRGDLVETVHPVSAVVMRGDQAIFQIEPAVSTHWRDAGKPFRVLATLGLNPDREALTDADLALGCASHSGQPQHVAAARDLLSRLGISVGDLGSGPALPLDEAARRAFLRDGAGPSPLYNPCVGEHAFMLAASRAQGWGDDYASMANPLQKRTYDLVREWTSADPGVGLDDCGATTFHLSLAATARAAARMAVEMATSPGRLAGRIGWTMAQRSELVSGEGMLDHEVTRRASVPLACKSGAEGVFWTAIPDRGAGIAVKVHSGHPAALAIAVRAVLQEYAPGLLLAEEWPWAVKRDVPGGPTARLVAVWG